MKERFSKLLVIIKKWLTKGFVLKKALISCGLTLLCFSLIYPTGSLSSETVDEIYADYIAEVARKHTTNFGWKNAKKLSGLIVEPKPGKGTKMRTDTRVATDELWGVFKGTDASFAPVMNANRIADIHFDDEHIPDDCLSLVYTCDGQSTEAYHKDEEGNTIDYKFQSSPLALMFPSALSGQQYELHVFISQTRAESILKNEHEGEEITLSALQSLQTRPTKMVIDGHSYDCIIDNIYLDNFDHSFDFNKYNNENYNYYYGSDIETVIGDFVYVILYANVAGVFPNDLPRQSLYVMSEHSFRNKFYLDYAKEYYSPTGYNYDYARYNLKNGFNPDNSILNRALTSRVSNAWCIVITILLSLVFAFILAFVYIARLYEQPLSLLMIAFTFIVPYLLFKIIFAATNNTLIFSSYSTVFNLILIIVFALAIILINLFGRKLRKGEKQ